jgi:hypothetical protein
MFAFLPTNLSPWEVVAFSGICAVTALSVAVSVGAVVGYVLTREPRVAPARAPQPQPQPTEAIPPIPAVARAIG